MTTTSSQPRQFYVLPGSRSITIGGNHVYLRMVTSDPSHPMEPVYPPGCMDECLGVYCAARGEILIDSGLNTTVQRETLTHEWGHAACRALCGFLDFTAESSANMMAILMNEYRDQYLLCCQWMLQHQGYESDPRMPPVCDSPPRTEIDHDIPQKYSVGPND